MTLVERMTALNARHISAASRLAGMEIEALGVRGASAGEGAPRESSALAERERLARDRRELEGSMSDIERERDALERRLREIDERLASREEGTQSPGKAG